MKRPPSPPRAHASSGPALLLRPGLVQWELWRLDGGSPQLLPLPGASASASASESSISESSNATASAAASPGSPAAASGGELADPSQPPAAASLPGRVGLAVPVRHLIALRLEQPESADPGEGIGLELEARGLIASPEPTHWTATVCGPPHPPQDQDSLPTRPVAVLLLGDEALDLAQELDATAAVPAPLALPLPADGLVLLRELGRPAAVVQRAGVAVHAQALGSPHWNRAAALELRLLLSALVAEGTLTRLPEPVTLLDAQLPDPEFSNHLGLALRQQPELPAPRWPGDISLPQLPHRLDQAARAQRRRTLLRIGALIALVIFGWLGFLAADVIRLSWQRGRLNAALESQAAIVKTLSHTDAQFATTIEPLLSGRTQPLEFQRTVQSLKPDGIRFERFLATAARVEIHGNANSVRDALEFQTRLQAAAAFTGWTWQNQQPTTETERPAFRFIAIAPQAEEEGA